MRYLVPLVLAATLTACVQPYGQRDPYGYDPYGYPPPPPPQGQDPYGYDRSPASEAYRAVGTEPFWSLTLDARDMRFESANGLRVSEPTPRVQGGFAGDIYRGRRIVVNIVHRECSDGMSDRRYPDQVQVYVDGREYRGCGGPERMYQGGWEQGYGDSGYGDPGYGYDNRAARIDRTNWRVTRINGLQVPSGSYYINFLPERRVTAKFGCNEMNGSYRFAGDRLDFGGGLATTRMACPDMSFETRANNVFARPLRVEVRDDEVSFSNDLGRIDAVRAR